MNELRVSLASQFAGDLRAARSATEAATAHEFAVMDAASPLLGYDASAYAPGQRGEVAQQEGRLEESLRWFQLGIERARARGATEVLCWNLSYGTEAWLAVGDLARAASMAREALEIGERLGTPTSRSLGECALCRVRVQEGDLDAATRLAEQWVESARSGAKLQVSWAISTLAVLRGARGERDEARRLAHEALAFAETGGFLLGQLWSELALARIHLSDGTPAACAEAVVWLARAEQTLETTGFFACLPDLLELRAELARQRGDAVGREAALREALRVYQANGATPHAERIARELAL